MKNFLFNTRSKALFGIGLVAITAGIISTKFKPFGCQKTTDISFINKN